jgi:hypothetical protein
MTHLERACESVDAAVFSSDMLFDAEHRAMLKDYLGRWTRAVQEHEGSVTSEQVLATLQELTALVRGECPSLLDEDSGGSSRLSLRIDECLGACTVTKGD